MIQRNVAAPSIETLTEYGATLGELPDGVAMDKGG